MRPSFVLLVELWLAFTTADTTGLTALVVVVFVAFERPVVVCSPGRGTMAMGGTGWGEVGGVRRSFSIVEGLSEEYMIPTFSAILKQLHQK